MVVVVVVVVMWMVEVLDRFQLKTIDIIDRILGIESIVHLQDCSDDHPWLLPNPLLIEYSRRCARRRASECWSPATTVDALDPSGL